MKELATITVSLSTVAILLVGGTAAYIIYGLSKSEHVHVPLFILVFDALFLCLAIGLIIEWWRQWRKRR